MRVAHAQVLATTNTSGRKWQHCTMCVELQLYSQRLLFDGKYPLDTKSMTTPVWEISSSSASMDRRSST